MGVRERPDRLRVIVFSAMPYETTAFENVLKSTPEASCLDIAFVSARLDGSTASLASGAGAVCLFASDYMDAPLLDKLSRNGVRLIALRYAGFSSVDIDKAVELGIRVARAPAHAATSIAEYTVTLMLALNRKVHLAYSRVRDGNLSFHGLVGFDMSNKTVGIIGTGKVGRLVARMVHGFGCQVLAFDIIESQSVKDAGGKYVTMGKLLASSDMITLHAPLVPGTVNMIGPDTLPLCKRGVHIINTSREGLINLAAIVDALRSGLVGGLAMDIFRGESSLFADDPTNDQDFDPNFQMLKSMPNVLITGHQSTLTTNALASVAHATVKTLIQFHNGEELDNDVKPGEVQASNS